MIFDLPDPKLHFPKQQRSTHKVDFNGGQKLPAKRAQNKFPINW